MTQPQVDKKLLRHEELSIRLGNGSGDGQAYCSIADIEEVLEQMLATHTQQVREELINSGLAKIVGYYAWNRQRGHTEVMLGGAKNADAFVLAANRQHADNLISRGVPRENIVTLGNLDRLRGHNKPLAIDHFALQIAVSDILTALNKEEK